MFEGVAVAGLRAAAAGLGLGFGEEREAFQVGVLSVGGLANNMQRWFV
ncbi:MAG: hypothetical protein HPY76_00215 [Anaerolineae bacterium]|nr:hypothetical protein [Anaerolineae bacterium]